MILGTKYSKATDPGILINIYPNPSTYTIPGPEPFVCGAGGAAADSPPVSVAAPLSTLPAPTTLATSIKATSTKAVPSSTSTHASLHGQCGGKGWTGPTTCASGTCKASSAQYSKLFLCIAS